MKVLVAYVPNDLRFVTMEKPKPGPREVLAKVRHCGICATDLSIMKGTLNLGEGNEPIYPVRIGHEWSGEIVEVGSETKRLKAGDRVISDTGYSCGECEFCLRGEYNGCIYGRAIGTIGECWPGGFAEYMLMPERLTFKVPDNVDLDEAALVEPASIGLYGLTRAPLGPNVNLLVVGTGPIGLGGMACAKGMGAGKTIIAGRQQYKLEIGKQMGADILVNMESENLYDVVMRETKGRGMDVVMDTTGATELFNDSIRLLRPSGYLVIPGFYKKLIKDADINNLVARNCTLIGAAGTPHMATKVLDMLSHGHMTLRPMITDRYSFDNAKEGFAAMTKKGSTQVKTLVDF